MKTWVMGFSYLDKICKLDGVNTNPIIMDTVAAKCEITMWVS